MKTIKKKDLDEVIRVGKKYYRTNDTDLLPKYFKLKEKVFGDDEEWVGDIISGLSFKSRNVDVPYETYYKVFEVLGFKIVEEEHEN